MFADHSFVGEPGDGIPDDVMMFKGCLKFFYLKVPIEIIAPIMAFCLKRWQPRSGLIPWS